MVGARAIVTVTISSYQKGRRAAIVKLSIAKQAHRTIARAPLFISIQSAMRRHEMAWGALTGAILGVDI
jgi:hypothetical protein